MHIPPPVHGASVMGKYIHDSELVNNSFDARFVNLSASSDLKEIGRLSFKKFWNMLLQLFTVLKLIRSFQPAVCYLTPSSSGIAFYRDYLLVKSIKLTGVKVLLHFHNKAQRDWLDKKYNQHLLKSFFKDVKIILLGKELYAEKVPFINKKDVYFLPNGVPAKESKASIVKTNSITHFLFLSNMIEEKGVYILLQACQIIKEQNLSFKCDFVGQYKDVSEKDFKTKVRSYGLEQEVSSHGPKYGDQKVVFFQNSDVFIFPTFYQQECLPLVLLEAMAYGLPCISTDNGAIPSVITEGETGFCLPQKEVQGLADRMKWMIENPDKRRKMGDAGKKRFDQNFTIDKFEKRLVEIIEKF